jgi:plasmid stabilization system protein ParE
LKYDVLVQPTADADIEAAYLYLFRHAAPDRAVTWYNRLEEAISTLDRMPRRCPIAPEDEFFAEEIHHLLVRPYRVLFTIRAKEVHVLHVRHMAQHVLEEPEE